MSQNLTRIDLDALSIGHYVHIELPWLYHPFSFNKFQISSADQIRTIRGLGLKDILVDLDKSEVKAPDPQAPVVETLPPAAPVHNEALARKQERLAQNQVLRSRIASAEKHFLQSARICKDLSQTIFSNPREAIAQASAVVGQIADGLLADREAMVHLLGDKVVGEEVYYHSLNVAMLALLLAKELNLPREALMAIGLAAVLHDLGKVEVPSRVLLKKDPWTAPERELYRQHVKFGVDIAAKSGVAREVIEIVAQHHEMADGSGYPVGLKGPQIGVGGRLLSLVNEYDNLCNPVDFTAALTPHEALSLMFSKRRAKFDGPMLAKLVHVLGVYPPGTVVLLGNGAIGMVLSINPAKPLRPMVMIYDEEVPKSEAIIVNLDNETDISISKALRPNQLPRPVYDYLSPRRRITYSFDQHGKGGR